MFESAMNFISTEGISIGIKIVGAIALWVVGRWLISMVGNLIHRALTTRKIDATLIKYLIGIIGVILNVVLVVGILGYFGVQTTTFAALLAGVGLAVGGAWSGLLGNFAAGAFLIILRPFKVGDIVEVNKNLGQVKEIGMFATTLINYENVTVIVGNGKVFGEDIINYSAQPVRRVDLRAQLNVTVDPRDAMEKLQVAIEKIPNVSMNPKPGVTILEFNPLGTVLAVRPYASADNYWQVYFDTNAAIARIGSENHWPAPSNTTIMKNTP